MFSDCLRAEFDAAGIGLTTICPGVVDTNIVRTTHIAPPDDRTLDVGRRHAKVIKFYERRGYGPDKVAKAIVSSVKKKKAIRPVTPEAYVAYGLARVAPTALRRTARRNIV